MLDFVNSKVLKCIALGTGGVLAGTAIYVSVVETKSRKNLDVKSMRRQWSDSFDNGALLVLGSGTVNFIANILLYTMDTSPSGCFWLGHPAMFLIGGVYSAFVMLPEIKELKDDQVVAKKGDRWVEEAINRWNRRHMFRTVINALGAGCTIWATVSST